MSFERRIISSMGVFLFLTGSFAGARESGEPAEVRRAPATELWSFQSLSDRPAPKSDDPWAVSPVDRFVWDRLDREQLRPSPTAGRRTLVRRHYLDLLGLPPTPEQISAFVDDPCPDAYCRLVERVLASPHYGERWAQHWLDVVGYGESAGYEANRERETAFHYRDFVVRALNEDRPYNVFVMQQLAGDALDEDAATGFLVAGPHDIVLSPDINLTLAQRQDELADIVNTTGTALLGLTIGCARCHDHKFDPISQADFYGLQAVFAGVEHDKRRMRAATTPALRRQEAELKSQLAAVDSQIVRFPARRPVQPADPGAARLL